MRVFVLLFNPGTDNEGIHTIRLASGDGSERNIVMMFEAEDDATRYAMLLEAQDFHIPAAEAIDSEEVEAFCRNCGYETKLIPEGFVPQSPEERVFLAPPETNMKDTEWSPENPTVETSDTSEPEIPNPELDEMRRRLEGLL
ncbi:DUF3110 domain-containing protein [Oscillatoriales cyanobacterium LEGE 11467]|uniref:DUF3110 domain-containing protein n=1 Tax=Zarconia navalis LEGE 11467 TaxID=1828826 RepID=A0A928W115_9CYAN|nr:DUF3110 domain-containing protein [Zarconia navalis]MBE9041908.1 DUF3110 domain-containing protein [Zarconia navalis LEGE 11467]